MYYKGADAAIILYDATSPFSWVSKELLSIFLLNLFLSLVKSDVLGRGGAAKGS